MGYVVIFTLKQVGISSNYIFKEWVMNREKLVQL